MTLLLQRNILADISGSFFCMLPMLGVLDLSNNINLRYFPEEISECVSLQYLSLSRTRIQFLPAGLLKLRKLIFLNLEYTRMVERIYGISDLTNLKVLRLLVSGFPEDPCVLDELQLLENLQSLTITLGLASILEQFLSSQRLASCTRVLRIENLNPQSSKISFVATMDSLRELYLAQSNISEIKVEMKEMVLPLHIPVTTPFFPNLSKVSLEFCKGLRDLTWLIFAPNLTVLRVLSASQLEEVIDKEKAEQQSLIPFQELKELRLENVEMLRSIHWCPLPFPCLQEILVNGCARLRKLPLNSTSAPRGDLVIKAHELWIEMLEWEDEATKARFLPSFKAFPENIDADGYEI
ncbi:putative disease resistance protein [Cardamine amara subsp. amara]|uniref:Disease resistance protein n=1 Tax=Cardamine amara subsp. amara TaxID=228776 RepID=A0ABD1AW35_CARAN